VYSHEAVEMKNKRDLQQNSFKELTLVLPSVNIKQIRCNLLSAHTKQHNTGFNQSSI
jgi:hypothetical protein